MGIKQNIWVACDTIVMTPDRKVLLVARKYDPFKGKWALPGGFAEDDEDLPDSAARELLEETSVGLDPGDLHQLKTYGKPGRDPRGRTVSIVYYHILPQPVEAVAADDAARVGWFSIDDLPEMAFDHREAMDDFLFHVIRKGNNHRG